MRAFAGRHERFIETGRKNGGQLKRMPERKLKVVSSETGSTRGPPHSLARRLTNRLRSLLFQKDNHVCYRQRHVPIDVDIIRVFRVFEAIQGSRYSNRYTLHGINEEWVDDCDVVRDRRSIKVERDGRLALAEIIGERKGGERVKVKSLGGFRTDVSEKELESARRTPEVRETKS